MNMHTPRISGRVVAWSLACAFVIAPALAAGVETPSDTGTPAPATQSAGSQTPQAGSPAAGPRKGLEMRAQRLEERSALLKERSQKKEEELKQRAQKLEEKTEARTQKLEEAKARLALRQKQKLARYADQMLKRLQAALDREKRLGDRIQSRIDKAKANGKNVAKAQAALDKAKSTWQEAAKLLDDVKAKAAAAGSAADAKAAFEEVKNQIADLARKLKEVHAAFVDATVALKGLGGGEEKAAAGTSGGASPAPAPSQ